jgi:hypothetical protein
MKHHFIWRCSYQGCVWFDFTDSTGRYEVRLRTRLEDYERERLNGPDVIRDEESVIGYLIRNGQPIPAETVHAFNAWRREEARKWNRKFDDNPDRYGTIAPDDPIRQPTWLAKGSAHWQMPDGWDWKNPDATGRGGFVFVDVPENLQTAA